jgi:hypothetical protein
MPFLEGPFAFTGKLDMLSAYRMRGVDKIVVRRKGGPSREKIKTGASFANTRRTMSEFGGCSRHGSYVRMAMLQIRHLSDYNFGSDINSVMRQVQLRDGTGEWGRRRITLSEHTRLLEGFSTVRKAPSFDSIVRAPVYYTMDRANRSARIDIPELLRDINYFPQNNHPLFRLTVTLGIVPDVTFDVPSKEYLPPDWYSRLYNSIEMSTDWNPSLEGMKSTTLELAMDVLPPDNRWTLMLSIGIEYGSFRENGKIKEVPRFGAAKIMALQGKDKTSDEGNGGDGTEGHKAHITNEVIVENVVPAPEVSSQGYRNPEVRYVYTTKEATTKQPEASVYCYAVPVPSQNYDTQNTVSLSCHDLCIVKNQAFPFTPEQIKGAHQQGKSDYPTFCKPCTARDVDKWRRSFSIPFATTLPDWSPRFLVPGNQWYTPLRNRIRQMPREMWRHRGEPGIYSLATIGACSTTRWVPRSERQ